MIQFTEILFTIFERLETLGKEQHQLKNKQKELEKKMESQQIQLDQLAAGLLTLDGSVQTITTEYEALKAQVAAGQTPLDFTAADAALTKLQTDMATLAATAAGSPATTPTA